MNGSATHSGLAELKALSSIIQDAVKSIESSVIAQNADFPSLHTPMTPESEAARKLPGVEQATAQIVAAAYQLMQSARAPASTAVAVALQYTLCAALGVATTANVAEALTEAGPKGAHVNDLAKASNIDAAKLARVLRLLATNHIFTEISPDVFTHNRISSSLDTGKSVKDILASPKSKHDGTTGIAAVIGHVTDEALKTGGYLEDALFDPKIAKSYDPTETAFNLAFNTKLSAWQWLETPENAHRLTRFGLAMRGARQATSPDAILDGFGWKSLAQDALVVDVGGGIGSQTVKIAQNNAHLRFVIQDREPVTKDAAVFVSSEVPGALESGRIKLQPHDFFAAQPVKNAAVFLLRNIIHDWPDKESVQILRSLRDAAAPETQLVVVDNLMSYACEDKAEEGVPGAQLPAVPSPLLPNMGHAASPAYSADIQMLEFFNGQERTISQLRELLVQAGWKLVGVHRSPAMGASKAFAVPA
ncbi:O-methyltransferase [Phanerochaete sordida]|uniref:O-methyltransferase n=1 Tax=Phanerochaete sordida TaxID=48140 RepID=A0A9P3FX22_9APHY|nr:O-methyltransferase [Phanerochaete sordida]